MDEDTQNIDALKLAKSRPHFFGDIKGIVPLFGGKCFDITLATSEAAAKLAQEGFDFENSHKPLCLLGQRSIHVSVFVSVEFPDEDLVNLLATYGELKSKNVRRLYFTEEGFTHIRHPCPARPRAAGKAANAKNDKEKTTWGALQRTIKQDAFAALVNSFLDLQKKHGIFTPTNFHNIHCVLCCYYFSYGGVYLDTTETDAEWTARMEREEAAAIAELKASEGRRARKQREEEAEQNAYRGHKCGGPSPSTSDDEQLTPNKKSSTPKNTTTGETTTSADDPPSQEEATPPTPLLLKRARPVFDILWRPCRPQAGNAAPS